MLQPRSSSKCYSDSQRNVEDGGVKIFYRGIGVGLAGMFPYAALDLGTFSTIKNY